MFATALLTRPIYSTTDQRQPPNLPFSIIMYLVHVLAILCIYVDLSLLYTFFDIWMGDAETEAQPKEKSAQWMSLTPWR